LGERVRYNGGHKHDRFLTETLGHYFQWVPVCPEVEIGLGTPREPVHLVEISELGMPSKRGDRRALGAGAIRLVGVQSRADHTKSMEKYAGKRVKALERADLCGYILKRDSPSCGMERVRLHHGDGRVSRRGRGLFATALLARFPNLPVEDEGRLSNPRLRENWIERVFAYRRLKEFWAGPWKLGDLAAFHAAHKLVLIAHSPNAYRSLARTLADARHVSRSALRAKYEREFIAALTNIATRSRHTKVLHYAVSHLGKHLDDDSRRELLAHIDHYRAGHVPRLVPHTLVCHYVRVFSVARLQSQVYFKPEPAELALLNHV
jgi:uncharacterized protein YbgA (DUF1722 family)/uncharacterized protein YbbK (DUF523 family)